MSACATALCPRRPCGFGLTYGSVPLPRMCCVHADGFMADLSAEVPAAEGRRGLERFRLAHEGWHMTEAGNG